MAERETVVLDEGYSLKQVRVMLKLCEAEPLYSTEQLKDPVQASEVMADALAQLDREYCCVVNLDSMLRPINFNVVSIGGISRTLVPVQNVFKAAILSNAAGIMLFHNHPSGSLTPSREDVLLTQRLVKAGQLMDIPVMDHVIVGGGGAGRCSLRSVYPNLFSVEEPEAHCGGQDKADRLCEPFGVTKDQEGDKITVLLVEPYKYPQIVQVGAEMEALRETVAEVRFPFQDSVGIVLYGERAGDMPLNRAVTDKEGNVKDIIAGNFLVAGLAGGRFCSLTPGQLEKYGRMFRQPQVFVQMGYGVMAVPVSEKAAGICRQTKEKTYGTEKRDIGER